MAEPRQQFFESQRLRMSYWEWGSPSRPALVLVHGGRDHSRSWDRVADAFADEWHVSALDLRGHGDSDWAIGSQYSVPDNMLDLSKLLGLVGAPAVLVGHSYGGQVCLATAATFPELVAGVFCIEGTSSLHPRSEPGGLTPRWLRTWAERVRSFEGGEPRLYETIEDAAARMKEANPRLPDDFVPHLAAYAVKPVEGGYVWKFDNWVHGRTSMDLRREERAVLWDAIECPVRLIYGEESTQTTIQGPQDAERFRAGSAVTVPEAGHWVHHDQLPTVLGELREFLQRIPGD